MFSQKRHQMVTLATLDRATIVIKRAKHHLHRDPLQGFAQGLGNLLTDRHQHRVENQGGIDLQLHRIGRARPHVGQIQEPFGQGERVLDAPAAPIQLADLAGRQHLRSKDIGQIPIPGTLPQDRHHAQRIRAGVRAILPHLDDRVTIIRAFAQHLHGAICGLFPHAGDKELLLIRKVIEPQKAEKAQVKHQQAPHRQRRQDLRGEALVIGGASSV